MVKSYLNQIGGKIENDINLFTGGLNTYINKAFIEDNQLSYVMNMGMYEPPKMSTRPSRLSLAWFFSEADRNDYAPHEDLIIKDFFAHNENEIYAILQHEGNTYLYLYKKGETTFTKKSLSLIPTYDKYYFCYCRQATAEYLYVMNESFKCRVQINSEETNYKEYEDDIYGIPAFHKGRLFIANPITNVVTFSALYDFDNYAKVEEGQTDVDYSVIAGDFMVTNAKGKVVALTSFDNKLLIFAEHSMHVLYGDSPNTEINFFSLVDLNNGIGAISQRAMAIGGSNLYWLGDDLNVYEYTGAYINIISKPNEYSLGGIEGLIHGHMFLARAYLKNVKFACSSSKLYIAIPRDPINSVENDMLLVYDLFNRVWWVEDGEFTSITDYQATTGTILLAKKGGDILIAEQKGTGQKDVIFNRTTNEFDEKEIEYIFETKVYGIDGVSMRKTLSEVWFQATAIADVYIGDYFTAVDHWKDVDGFYLDGYLKIGTLRQSLQPRSKTSYNPYTYESQRSIVPKMQIERVNGFTILVKGKGFAEFFLMERKWRAI